VRFRGGTRRSRSESDGDALDVERLADGEPVAVLDLLSQARDRRRAANTLDPRECLELETRSGSQRRRGQHGDSWRVIAGRRSAKERTKARLPPEWSCARRASRASASVVEKLVENGADVVVMRRDEVRDLMPRGEEGRQSGELRSILQSWPRPWRRTLTPCFSTSCCIAAALYGSTTAADLPAESWMRYIQLSLRAGGSQARWDRTSRAGEGAQAIVAGGGSVSLKLVQRS
jgi:hypothetical protein